MNKAKVYQGVACLEVYSPDGGKWWYQTGTVAYTPILIKEIRTVRYGKLEGSARTVLAIPLEIRGREQLIALNLPRTDLRELKNRGLWPRDFEAPFPIEEIRYTPWPEYARNAPRTISLNRK